MTEQTLTRDFTVAVFVVHAGRTILHRHPKLGILLPPGGHIEPNELPDEAALREVMEETGLAIELVGERGIGTDYAGQPRQLVRPEGIQLETIGSDHEHIDLIYFARPAGDPVEELPALSAGMEWFSQDELGQLKLTEEVADWAALALGSCKRW